VEEEESNVQDNVEGAEGRREEDDDVDGDGDEEEEEEEEEEGKKGKLRSARVVSRSRGVSGKGEDGGGGDRVGEDGRGITRVRPSNRIEWSVCLSLHLEQMFLFSSLVRSTFGSSCRVKTSAEGSG
jgi:hypothetical protein